jgi:GNAT superfamily N-acetyltransferase
VWLGILGLVRGRRSTSPQASYPSEFERQHLLSDGTPLTVRPIRPDDQQQLGEMFAEMSEESLYQRFISAPRAVDPALLREFCRIDYDEAMALVATLQIEERDTIVGEARYVREAETDFADVAVAVVDSYQGRGIGQILVRSLAEVARARGLSGFTGEALAANTVIIHVFHAAGLSVGTTQRGGIYRLRVTWEQPPARRGWRKRLGHFFRRPVRELDDDKPPTRPHVWTD